MCFNVIIPDLTYDQIDQCIFVFEYLLVKIILNFIQIKVKVMAERQIILSNMEALVGADLSKAFKAVRGEKVRNVFEKIYSFLINEHIIPPVFPLIQLNVSIETFIICTAPMPSHNPKAPPSSEKNLVKEKSGK